MKLQRTSLALGSILVSWAAACASDPIATEPTACVVDCGSEATEPVPVAPGHDAGSHVADASTEPDAGDASVDGAVDAPDASDAGGEAPCAGHGELHGDHCHCDEGYEPEGDTCVPVTPEPEPELPAYTLVPIGFEGFESHVVGLNDARQVTGNLRSAGNAQLHAYRWSYDAAGGTLVEATPMDGQNGNTFSRPYAISPLGVVVGEANNDSSRAFRWTSDGTTLVNLARGVASGVNATGTTVGWSSHAGNGVRAVRFVAGDTVVEDLGSLDGRADTVARAWAIDVNGNVVGQSANDAGVGRATLWRNDRTLVNLGGLRDGKPSRAAALNSKREIVGAAIVSETGTEIHNAFRWNDGTITNLGTLPAAPAAVHSEARGINDSGWIVGEVTQLGNYSVGEAHAVMWIGGRIFDLDAALPAGSDWHLLSARAIDTQGDIAGVGRLGDKVRAFLLVRQ